MLLPGCPEKTLDNRVPMKGSAGTNPNYTAADALLPRQLELTP